MMDYDAMRRELAALESAVTYAQPQNPWDPTQRGLSNKFGRALGHNAQVWNEDIARRKAEVEARKNYLRQMLAGQGNPEPPQAYAPQSDPHGEGARSPMGQGGSGVAGWQNMFSANQDAMTAYNSTPQKGAVSDLQWRAMYGMQNDKMSAPQAKQGAPAYWDWQWDGDSRLQELQGKLLQTGQSYDAAKKGKSAGYVDDNVRNLSSQYNAYNNEIGRLKNQRYQAYSQYSPPADPHGAGVRNLLGNG